MTRSVQVYGPAYLDRVLRIDRPLAPPEFGGPIDLSVEGHWQSRDPTRQTLRLVDPEGGILIIKLPSGWPEEAGEIALARPLIAKAGPWRHEVQGLSWDDDLGGMGAGYAQALVGVLHSALGAENDPVSQGIARRLAEVGIAHRPVLVPGTSADWTLLVTSGPHGDKLPVGFRGCHSAVREWDVEPHSRCDLLIVASLPNRLASKVFQLKPAGIRLFAPALRNILDREPPLVSFSEQVDILCCNQLEWNALADRETIAARLSLLAVTNGPEGAKVWYRTSSGDRGCVAVAAFPRAHPPRDTNRAGEAFASTLVATLLDAGWTPGPTDPALAQRAAERASVAAALELDLLTFGFPTSEQIDAALRKNGI